MRRGIEFRDLTLGFMRQMGLRPCFDMAITTTVTKRKGEMAALRLELYRTARSIAELEYWRQQVRLLRNGKKTGVWRHKQNVSCSWSHRLILWVPSQAERGGCMQGNGLEKESCAQLPLVVLFRAYSD